MTDKYCIIIDDEDQDEIVENLIEDARRLGIALTCFQLNPLDDRFNKNVGSDSAPEDVIDLEKIVEALGTNEYRRSKVNVIACDYRLQDDHVNGFEVIRKLRNELNFKGSVILYSANLETVIADILLGNFAEQVERIMSLVNANIPENLEAGIKEVLAGDLKGQIHRIRNLTHANISALKDKDSYKSSIITALEQESFSMETELDSLLNNYRDWTFRSVFPPFSDKKVSEIAEEIDSGSPKGISFQKALLENAVAHMLELNKEINE